MTNRLDAARLQPLTVRVAIIAIVLAALAMLAQWQFGGRAAARAGQGAALAALAETLPLQAASAAGGNVASFEALADSRARLVQALGESGLDGDPAWSAVLEQSQAVLDGRATAESVARAAVGARDLTPQVLAATANVARAMGAARPDAFNRQLERFELRARSLEQDLAALSAGAPIDATVQRLGESLEYMSQVVGGLNGEANPLGITAAQGPAADAARLLSAVFQTEQQQVRAVMAAADPLEQVHAAAAALAQSGPKAAAAVPSGGGALPAWASGPWIPLALVLIALAALGFMVVLQRSLATLRREADRQAEQNERNQQAILRLLDELSSLADGDLTVQASVTEDITGAIADSINYAIEALRELVTTINDSAIKLDAATRAGCRWCATRCARSPKPPVFAIVHWTVHRAPRVSPHSGSAAIPDRRVVHARRRVLAHRDACGMTSAPAPVRASVPVTAMHTARRPRWSVPFSRGSLMRR